MRASAPQCPGIKLFGTEPVDDIELSRELTALKQAGPVVYIPEQDMYVVTRFADICAVAKDPEHFSSSESLGFPMEPRVLVTADPPFHRSHRNLAARAFSSSRIKAREPLIESVVDRLIDDFIERGRFDFVADLAAQIPVFVIADFLGVAVEDRAKFKLWTSELALPIGSSGLSQERMKLNRQRLRECDAYFLALIAERRANPGEDMISDMIARGDAGEEPFEDAEVLRILTQILIGGNETTTKMMTSAMEQLLKHPDVMQQIRPDPDLIPRLLSETLRLKPPMHGMFRKCVADADVGGVSVPAGAKVMMMFSSANRDEGMFPDAEEFDLARPNSRAHLAFSHGAHFCLGNQLAQLEGNIAFRRLFARLDHIRMSPDNRFDPIPSFVLQGLRSLQLEFDKI